MFRLLLFVGALCLLPSIASAQRITLSQRTVAEPLQVPWEILWGPDNWIWFTERDGNIARIHPETGETKVLITLPRVAQRLESGVLGLELHPSFQDTPFVYVAYTYFTPDSAMQLKVERYRYEGEKLIEPFTILDGLPAYESHNGCRLAIYNHKLYVSTGEIWVDSLAQDDRSLNGKILRLNLDGTIPHDNPWPGSAVWSKGHRNPQGLVFGQHGILYSSEHGHTTDDEINLIEPGVNYGWPKVEGYADLESEHQVFADSNIRAPLFAWTPTVATSGMVYYNHESIPEWRNSLLVATLKNESIWQLKLDSTGREIVEVNRYHLEPPDSNSSVRRLRDLCISPEGRVFVSTSFVWVPGYRWERLFEVTRTGVEPFTLQLHTPTDSVVLANEFTRLSWYSISKIAEYHVQVSSDTAFSTLLLDVTTRDTSVALQDLKDGMSYYWRARESRTNGPWTSPRSLRVELAPITTIPTHPMPGAHVQTFPVMLAWQGPHSDLQYEVEVATDTFFTLIHRAYTVSDTCLQFDELEDGNSYYWRVRALHPRGLWSNTHSFRYLDSSTPPSTDPEVITALPTVFTTSMRFTLDASRAGRFTLRIVDEIGRTISTVFDSHVDPGTYSYEWRPNDLPFGSYWYQLSTESGLKTGKLMYVPVD